MCISFLFTNPGDGSIKYKVILINNRDEFYARETQKATLFREDDLSWIHGTDLAAVVRGTWLGVSANKDGTIRLGNLANVTGANNNQGKMGRGPIVVEWIKSHGSIEEYNNELYANSQEFGSFNHLSVQINSDEIKTFYVSNTPKTSQALPLGYTGLGNSPLHSPFKKVEEGTKQFKDLLESHKEKSKDDLIDASLDLLKSSTQYFPDPELTLRRNASAEFFSSIDVRIPTHAYGTRTRTVILVDQENNIDYVEDTMTSEDPNGEWERTYIKIPKNDSIDAQL